jgi:putative nucleotidyltransferase with HDIG domain
VSLLPADSPAFTPINVLVVDDDESVRSLILRHLSSEPAYHCISSSSALEACEHMHREQVSVVISDIRMPQMSGVEFLHFLGHAAPETSVIMVTGLDDIGTALESLRMGACDYITKPFDMLRLRRALGQAVERNRLLVDSRRYREELERKVAARTHELNGALRELEDSYRTTLDALVSALDAREHETQAHSQRVREYAVTLARQLGLNEASLVDVGRGALLHDVGKIGVPDSILLKPGKLTPEEWVIMRRHSRIGYDILRNIRFLAGAAEIVLAHQERWDGRGYPTGLAGTDIPLGARIFAVVDTVDAMTSDRPYRKALPFQAATEEVGRCSGTQFDPMVAQAFLSIRPEIWTEIHKAVNSRHRNRHCMDVVCRT